MDNIFHPNFRLSNENFQEMNKIQNGAYIDIGENHLNKLFSPNYMDNGISALNTFQSVVVQDSEVCLFQTKPVLHFLGKISSQGKREPGIPD